MNRYDQIVARYLCAPLVFRIVSEWDDAMIPIGRAWIHEAPEGDVEAAIKALERGEISAVSDPALHVLWTISINAKHRRAMRGAVRFNARERDALMNEVLRRSVAWKAEQ